MTPRRILGSNGPHNPLTGLLRFRWLVGALVKVTTVALAGVTAGHIGVGFAAAPAGAETAAVGRILDVVDGSVIPDGSLTKFRVDWHDLNQTVWWTLSCLNEWENGAGTGWGGGKYEAHDDIAEYSFQVMPRQGDRCTIAIALEPGVQSETVSFIVDEPSAPVYGPVITSPASGNVPTDTRLVFKADFSSLPQGTYGVTYRCPGYGELIDWFTWDGTDATYSVNVGAVPGPRTCTFMVSGTKSDNGFEYLDRRIVNVSAPPAQPEASESRSLKDPNGDQRGHRAFDLTRAKVTRYDKRTEVLVTLADLAPRRNVTVSVWLGRDPLVATTTRTATRAVRTSLDLRGDWEIKPSCGLQADWMNSKDQVRIVMTKYCAQYGRFSVRTATSRRTFAMNDGFSKDILVPKP